MSEPKTRGCFNCKKLMIVAIEDGEGYYAKFCMADAIKAMNRSDGSRIIDPITYDVSPLGKGKECPNGWVLDPESDYYDDYEEEDDYDE